MLVFLFLILCICDGKLIKPSKNYHKRTLNREEALTAAQGFINGHKPVEPQVNYTQRVLNAVQTHYNSMSNSDPKKQLLGHAMGNLTRSAANNPVHFERVAKSSFNVKQEEEKPTKLGLLRQQLAGGRGNDFDFLKMLKEKEGLKVDLHNKMIGEVKKRRRKITK
jgi:hypothetical protein